MKKIIDKIANLLNVKTVVTFAVTAVFCNLALKGSITPDTVMTVVVMVLGFYFGTQYEQNAQKKKDNENEDEKE